MCLRKKKKIITPKRLSPEPVIKKSPIQHKREVSEELKIALENYRKYNPKVLVIDSPRYGLEKRELTFSLH